MREVFRSDQSLPWSLLLQCLAQAGRALTVSQWAHDRWGVQICHWISGDEALGRPFTPILILSFGSMTFYLLYHTIQKQS